MKYLMIPALVALAGCVAEPNPGQELYESYCVACHGKGGQGDGPMAGNLPVPPADLTALSLANDGVFPMSEVMAQVHGYPSQFHERIMPEFGPLLAGREVQWTDETGAVVTTPAALLDLARYIETLQQAE